MSVKADIRNAFEEAVLNGGEFGRRQSETTIRRQATLLMKQFEAVIESLPDHSMTLGEFYEEIAGQAWRG